MTSDQYIRIYERKREDEGAGEAVRGLFRLAMRDLDNQFRIQKPKTDTEQARILLEIEEKWRAVAGATGDFAPEDLRDLISEVGPHSLAGLFDHMDQLAAHADEAR